MVRLLQKSFFVLAMCLLVGTSWAVEEFSFIHTSDDHFPRADTEETIAKLAQSIHPTRLAPYNITAPTPSFLIDTGDLTEFGGGRGINEHALECYKALNLPFYITAGNHDNTWYAVRSLYAKTYGGPCYSFDKFGCHFIGLESAGIHEPLPAIGKESLTYLKKDLEKVSNDTPIFIFMHHVLSGDEYATKLERDRILDMLRSYAFVVFMVGHGHSATHIAFDGMDAIEGGSTWGPNDRGWSVCNVTKDKFSVAWHPWDATEANRAIFERPLKATESYLDLEVKKPRSEETVGATLAIDASWKSASINAVTANYQIDGDESIPIALDKQSYKGEADLTKQPNGAHYLRVNVKSDKGTVYHKSVVFYKETTDKPHALWRTPLAGSSKCTPTLSDGVLYVGANDGGLYALKAKNGKELWKFSTGLDVVSKPLVLGNAIYFGSADGSFYAVDKKGNLLWKASSKKGEPFYSSPATDGEQIFTGCEDGNIYAFDAKTGKPTWINKEPKYTIESPIFYFEGAVYAGAWDEFIYAVDSKTGALKWKVEGAVSSTKSPGAGRYYSPGDNGPLATATKVFCADRAYALGFFNASDGTMVSQMADVAGIAFSEDRQSIYLRQMKKLAKIDLDGKVLWSAEAQVGRNPTSPTESKGRVYVCGNNGLLQCFNAQDGAKIWDYQVTPWLYVYSSVTVDNGVAYVSGMDGTVVAVVEK